ncbi:MAG: FAD-dependent oxidoreductase [Desulfovibrionaceae bacterium]|nr:FAD-dependent oxidoreductase [Desulfovibrionaceae bacterium]
METGLLVLGGGPAGHAGALEAAGLGLSVVLVEREHLGGTCLNRGCIPTKLFLGATAAGPELESAAKLKLAAGSIDFDLPALQTRKERIVTGSRKAIAAQLADAGVRVVAGAGRCTAPGVLEVAATGETGGTDGTGESGGACAEIRFDACILATGSRPAAFPGLEPDGDAVLNSDHALELAEAPESLLVVGGGAIGLEMADFFGRLGTRITVIEGLAHLAPTEDPEVGETLARVLKRRGAGVRTGARVASLKTVDGKALLVLESGEELTAAKALVAAGRLPNSRDLGLEHLGVHTRGPGWIVTDDRLLAAPGVAAVGDVNGRTLLAHAAAHQARFAARLLAGRETGSYAAEPMPSCVYGHVEAMRAGPTTAQLKATGREVLASTAQLAANPMAQAAGATQGFVRVLWLRGADGEDRVAGMSAVGHGVSHLVTQAQLIIAAGWREADAHAHIFAHPSLDEALQAALAAPRTAA